MARKRFQIYEGDMYYLEWLFLNSLKSKISYLVL